MTKELKETTETKQVYKTIAAIAGEMAKEGISKSRENAQQGYKFRGIDEIYNALAPMLSTHGLVILPRVKKRDVIERTTQRGGVLFYVTLEVDFDFVCVWDGSQHVVTTFGEAMDSGDKATNKAMSAAYKYACLQAFCIPTEGDNDADATTHIVVPQKDPVKEVRAWLTRARKAVEATTEASELEQWKFDNIEELSKLSDEQKKWFDDILSKKTKSFNQELTILSAG